MSKIAEEKALEEYPIVWKKMCGDGIYDINREHRECYLQGYKQAEKDIIDKACMAEEIIEEAKKHRHITYGDSDMLSFVEGAEWMQRQLIGKACEWLYSRQVIDLEVPDVAKFISDFKKEMEGEQ